MIVAAGRGLKERERMVFELFTDQARNVVVLADEQARMLGHDYLDTERLLLGLIGAGESVAVDSLRNLNISLESIQQQLEMNLDRGQQASRAEHLPYTPGAKRVLELSLREAETLGHNYIGVEHILLGLIHEGAGLAARTLVNLGGDLTRVRAEVTDLLSSSGELPRSTWDDQNWADGVRSAQPGRGAVAPADEATTGERVLVVGLGSIGMAVAQSLQSEGHELVLVDEDPRRLDDARDDGHFAVAINPTSADQLKKRLGVVDQAVVAIEDDLQTSLLAVVALRAIGVEQVWAIGFSRQHGVLLEGLGADNVILHSNAVGERVAQLMAP